MSAKIGNPSDYVPVVIDTRKRQIDIQQYIEENVKINETGCWVWQLSIRPPPLMPYGQVWYEGTNHNVHRLMYKLCVGDPGKLYVLHNCDNPPCCNPEHLFLGTHVDNVQDMIDKGRRASTKGENHGGALISEAQAIEILHRISQGAKPSDLFEQYGRHIVKNLVAGLSWKHLPRPEPLYILW